jgi:hypothetical protein
MTFLFGLFAMYLLAGAFTSYLVYKHDKKIGTWNNRDINDYMVLALLLFLWPWFWYNLALDSADDILGNGIL